MPKDFTAPSQQWNIQDQINKSKPINAERYKKLDDYTNETNAFGRIKSTLDEYENQGLDVSSYRDRLDAKLKDNQMGFGEKLGVIGRNVGLDYVQSFSKAFGGDIEKSYSQKVDEAKIKREQILNPISTIASEVAIDPLTYTPLSFASKGSTAVRAAKDFAKGGALTSGLYAAKEYGSDDFSTENALLSGAFGGAINAGLGRFFNRGHKDDTPNPDITSGDATNIKPQQTEVTPTQPIQPITSQDDIAKKINDNYFGNQTVQPQVTVPDSQYGNKVNDFFNPTKLPPKEDMVTAINNAIDTDTTDDFISKLPDNVNKEKISNSINIMREAKAKQGFQPKEMVVNGETINKTDFETANRMGVIPFSNGSQTLGGGAAGGLESEFNQRDYNNDGTHNYKDTLYGALVGAVGINAARKLMPNAFKDANIDKNTASMFVGAKPNDKGAFSDVATRKVMREIDDRGAKLNKQNLESDLANPKGGYFEGTLGDIFSHKKLEETNPELKNINVVLDIGEDFSSSGSYNPKRNELVVTAENARNAKSVILHEIQHAIQSKEGWARGGSTEEFNLRGSDKLNQSFIDNAEKARSPKVEQLVKDLADKKISKEEFKKIYNEMPETKTIKEWTENIANSKDPYGAYQRLWGEQQARATQARMNYTQKQRASEDWTQTLAKTEGRYNEPIIKYDDGVANSEKINREEKILGAINKLSKEDFLSKASRMGSKDTSEMIALIDSKSSGSLNFNEVRAALGKNNYFEDKVNPAILKIQDEDLIRNEIKNSKVSLNGPIVVNSKNEVVDGRHRAVYAKDNNIDEIKAYISDESMYRKYNKSEAKSPHKQMGDMTAMSSPTLSGGMVGGIVGANNDLNGDGKTDYKDILIGIGGGAAGTKGALLIKNTQIATKAKSIIKAIGDMETVDKALGHKIYQKKDYMALREAMIKSKNADAEKFALLHEQLKLLDDTTRTKMYNYMNGDKSIQLEQNVKQLADNYTNEINKMGKELVDLGVLEQAQFDKFKDRYLHRRYEKDLSQKFNSLFTKGKTIQGVHARGNEWTGTKTEFDALTKNGEIGDFFSGKIEATRMQNGQYKFRQDWTEAQRNKWGEVKDIAFSLPETLMRTKEMVEHATMLKKIVDQTGYVSDDAIEGYTQLQGKRFGALNGKYVPTDMKLDITEFGNSLFGEEGKLLGSKAMEAFKVLSTFWKKSHTVYNPIAHLNNLISNVTMQFGAGINPHKAIANATKGALANQKVNQFRELTAKKLIGLSQEEQATLRVLSQDEDLKLWNQAQESGLFGRSNLNDILNKYVNPTPTPTKTKGLNKAAKKIDDFASSMYQGEDNIMRFSMMKSLMEDGATFDAAFKSVNETIPDYTKPMSQWARFGRDSMLTPFISWTYYATPIILKQMKDRPERVVAIYAALYGMNQMWGIDPFNEKDIPQQNFSMKRIPIYQNGNEVTTVKVDRWVPHGDILSPLDFVKNLTSGGAWAGGQDVLRNRNSYFGGKITNREGGEKAYDLTKYAVSQITPDILDNIGGLVESSILSKEKRTKNPVIQPRTTTQELLKILGINSITYNKSNQAKEIEKQRLNKLKKGE
jgi:crotonobetainyl-CoA:carnitine CoA-transferase CaiB-like acyl-CoA transferase